MNCRRAQTDIALWAGNDLDESDRRSLQRHLEACPDCREYRAQMQALMQLVEDCPLKDEADSASESTGTNSLWPALSTHLVSLPSRAKSDRFNGWVPAVAVAAVCLAMLMVASPQLAFPTNSASFHSDVTHSTELPSPAIAEREREPLVNMLVDDHLVIEKNLSNLALPRRAPAFPPGFPQETEVRFRPKPRTFSLRDLPEGWRVYAHPSGVIIFEPVD